MDENKLLHSDITEKIIEGFYNVYNTLGYGFLEKVYEEALCIELKKLGLTISRQKKIDVYYSGKKIGHYIPDIIVDDKIIVELKAVEHILKEHEIMLVNYLKASEVEVGLILNFGPKAKFIRRVLTEAYKNSLKK
jgi:GxxExxY protein